MTKQKDNDLLLSGLRALDLTDDKGFLCGKILGDLGVDVIKIERPGGDSSRNIGPFYQDIPHPEKSLYWFAYNNNKRGITLNIETSDGQGIFKRLAGTADFVIESFRPGYMEELGLGYSVLAEINPRIIMASITPFGQTGPYKDFKASDLIINAMGGFTNLIGYPDRPPLRISFPQAYLHGGLEAAVGSIIAYYYREMTGQGQWVDVSIQASMFWSLVIAPFWQDFTGWELGRQGIRVGARSTRGGEPKAVYESKDGYVTFVLYGGQTGARTNQGLTEWMDSKGMAPDFLKSKHWVALDMASLTLDELNQMEDAFSNFFQTVTTSEFQQVTLGRGMMGDPVATTKDVAEDPQLESRGYWEKVEHRELGTTINYPGALVKFAETPCHIRRSAPLIGEHNREIYEKELGFSREQLVTMKQANII